MRFQTSVVALVASLAACVAAQDLSGVPNCAVCGFFFSITLIILVLGAGVAFGRIRQHVRRIDVDVEMRWRSTSIYSSIELIVQTN